MAVSPNESLRPRWLYAALVVLTVLFGLASRRFAGALPVVLRKYTGDAAWALMVFFIVGLLLPRRPAWWNAAVALAFSVLIEFSQLYHAQWIDTVRGYRLGHLVLGFGFAWHDMIAYTVGVLVGFAGEWAVKSVFMPRFRPETPI